MGTPEQTGGALSAGRLIPIAVAAARLGRSVWTLKRWYRKGRLPVVICGQWMVPESFIDMVFAAMRPGRAADIAEVAGAWFAANAEMAQAS